MSKTTTIPWKLGLNEVIRLDSDSNVNLDDLYGYEKAGLYYITNGVPGSPHDWSMLFVLAWGGVTSQLLIGSKALFRVYVGNPASWTSWRRIMNSIPETYTSDNIIAKKIDNIVQLRLATESKTYTSTGWNKILTLPAQYRPSMDVYFPAYDNGSGSFSANTVQDIRISSSGDVDVYVFSDKKTIALRGNVTYITNYYTG